MERSQPTVFVVQLSPQTRRWTRNHLHHRRFIDDESGLARGARALALTCSLVACDRSMAAPTPQAGTTTSTTQMAPAPLLASTHAAGTASVGSNAQPQISKTLTLGTWNLAWLSATNGRGPVRRTTSDYERLARHARRINADILAVQEVESVEALGRVFDSNHYNFHLTSDRTSQKTGFVYAKHLDVEVFPDYREMAFGGLRSGADIGVRFERQSLRLLSVHLKSGCFDQALNRNRDCRALGAQVPKLEDWLDARATESTWFAALGDFNRRLFGRTTDEVWSALDDGVPPESDLDAPTRNRRSTCWGAIHPQYIDHLVLSRTLSRRVLPGSFQEVNYGPSDVPFRKQLSDHCPITVTLTLGPHGLSAAPPVETSAVAADSNEPGPVRGNISRSGKRWYHTIDCPAYHRVKIDTTKGERYFETEEEAQHAGFERAPTCRK